MKTAQEVLEFISEYVDSCLEEVKKETNPSKAKIKYREYDGIRKLLNTLVDEMKWMRISKQKMEEY